VCGDTLPIIYSSEYNISILGIEYFHPFDTKKFKRIYNYLRKHLGLCSHQFLTPYKIAEEELLTVHSQEYLVSLNKSKNIAQIVEIPPLRILPNAILRNGILKPMQFGTGGTVTGAIKAFETGWAINLAGGYHHAKADNGEGFCFYADIPLAINKLRTERPQLKVLVIDLDAHQGNGCSSILGDDKRISILDIYNKKIYPHDTRAEKKLTYNLAIYPNTEDSAYLSLLSSQLPKAIEEQTPDLIIYNAGTDIFELDPLGGLLITEKGIIQRDQIVFENAVDNNIPILMVLSGGYHKKSGEIIAKSIINLLKTVLKDKVDIDI
jgi:histone deacetylase 11